MRCKVSFFHSFPLFPPLFLCSDRISYVYTNDRKVKGDGEGLGKKDEKKGGKDSQLILRLEKRDRDEFVALCKEMDTSAAREIRRFIREFIKENS